MTNDQRQEWVIVAEFSAMDTGFAADMAVSKLEGSGVPAMRFPGGSITSVLGGAVPVVEPIRVVVPPEHEERAREILAEQADATETFADE